MHLSWHTLAIYVPMLALLAVAAITDLRVRRIPNWVSLTVAVAGLAQSAMSWGVTTPLQALLGLATGFAVTFLLYIVGGRGAGDVKLTAGIGAWLGPLPVVVVLMGAALVSLVLAVGQSAIRGRLGDLFRNTGLMLISLLHIRRLGARSVIHTGQTASMGKPLPNAVSMLVATVGVVVWVSSAKGAAAGITLASIVVAGR